MKRRRSQLSAPSAEQTGIQTLKWFKSPKARGIQRKLFFSMREMNSRYVRAKHGMFSSALSAMTVTARRATSSFPKQVTTTSNSFITSICFPVSFRSSATAPYRRTAYPWTPRTRARCTDLRMPKLPRPTRARDSSQRYECS